GGRGVGGRRGAGGGLGLGQALGGRRVGLRLGRPGPGRGGGGGPGGGPAAGAGVGVMAVASAAAGPVASGSSRASPGSVTVVSPRGPSGTASGSATGGS